MADVTNEQVVRFANEHGRGTADAICQLYYRLDRVNDLWTQQGIGTLISGNDDADTIIDGAAEDGRPLLTVGKLETLMAQVQALLTTLDNEAEAPAVNPCLQVAVNPGG